MSSEQPSRTPVVISAPTARNGVTLLQRLLNSSRQIVIFGENLHLCEWMPLVVQRACEIHTQSEAQFKVTRQRFLNETTEFWSSGLWPNSELYAKHAVCAFWLMLDAYTTGSQEMGFSRWGIKHPFATLEAYRAFRSLLPGGRFIYIYRNLFDVARSAKARRFVKTVDEVAELAKNWREGVAAARVETAKNVLVIKYEQLIAESQAWIERIQQLTGVAGIDPSVMTRKYNTFRGPESAGLSSSEYIAPESLTPDEVRALQKNAGDMLEAEGYTDQAQRSLTQANRPVAEVQLAEMSS